MSYQHKTYYYYIKKEMKIEGQLVFRNLKIRASFRKGFGL